MRLSRKELGAELRAVKAAVSSRPGIPALTGALLEASNDGRELTITATDLEATVRTEIAAEASDGGGAWRALVPFKVLSDAVKGSGSVELSPADASTFRAGSATIRTLPIEDFPEIVAGGTYIGRADAQDFRRAVDAVAPAASRDEARPVLTGILLETDGGSFKLTATDSYRLHHSEVRSAVLAGECKAIIPARALVAVSKRIGAKGTGGVVLELSEGSVAFKIMGSSGSEYVLRSRVIEGEYPNYRQLIPEAYESRLSGLAELREAVSSVSPLCRDTSPARIDVDSYGMVTVSASSPDLGSCA
jgi:DNA polymerase-3 subunit beta